MFEQPENTPEGMQEIMRRIERVREMREWLDKEAPEEYEALWEECREKIHELEEDREKAEKEFKSLPKTEEDIESYEAYLVAYEEMINDIQNRFKNAEELHTKVIPGEILREIQRVKGTLKHSGGTKN